MCHKDQYWVLYFFCCTSMIYVVRQGCLGLFCMLTTQTFYSGENLDQLCATVNSELRGVMQ